MISQMFHTVPTQLLPSLRGKVTGYSDRGLGKNFGDEKLGCTNDED